MIEDDLPHEVILAIQRVLEVNNDVESDPLDALSTNFSPVDVLNDLFPDGKFYFLQYNYAVNLCKTRDITGSYRRCQCSACRDAEWVAEGN